MVKAVLAGSDYEKLRNYNKVYYQKNKERLLIYQKIYKDMERDKTLKYLKDYYESVIKDKEQQWSEAMPSCNSTRPKRNRICYDRGKKISGLTIKREKIIITFD
mgnify:CR=1 FL=1